MIVVTGGAGFIGSNVVRALNDSAEDDILVVDDLTDTAKIRNLEGCRFCDYMDKDEFLDQIRRRGLTAPSLMFHQGACSDTMESNGKFMMEQNFTYSKALLHYSLEQGIPFIYASSGSVYGAGREFTEDPAHENALNVYALSKLQFDRYVRRVLPHAGSQVAGLRYFNVYGPGEAHKGRMASVAYHFYHQYLENGQVKLFVGSDGYGDGAQERDFVWVEDVARVNLHLMEHSDISGIFNVGTGESRAFNDVALAVINASEGGSSLTLEAALKAGKIAYMPFPESLQEKYQSYTCADTRALRNAGYSSSFMGVEEGVRRYVSRLKGTHDV